MGGAQPLRTNTCQGVAGGKRLGPFGGLSAFSGQLDETTSFHGGSAVGVERPASPLLT